MTLEHTQYVGDWRVRRLQRLESLAAAAAPADVDTSV